MTPVAFTLRGQGLVSVLTTQVNIHIPNNPKGNPFTSIWDTGATGTAITTRIVQILGLIPSGGKNVQTANGIVYQNTYIISVGIPNLAMITDIVATEVGSLSGGCDVLIGMDIITLGDFSITNHEGKTCMSFRMPSMHEIDYVKTLNMRVSSKTPTGGSSYTPPHKKRKKR